MSKLDELLFTVDEENIPLTPRPRKEVHTKGYWHRTTQIWVVNKQKQILCQRRSLAKDVNPGMWEAFFGGHVAADEDYLENAVKEIQEELGITVSKDSFTLFTIAKLDHGKEFRAVYFLKWDGNSNEIAIQKDEVEEVKWFPIKMLTNLLVEEKDNQWNISGKEKEILGAIEMV